MFALWPAAGQLLVVEHQPEVLPGAAAHQDTTGRACAVNGALPDLELLGDRVQPVRSVPLKIDLQLGQQRVGSREVDRRAAAVPRDAAVGAAGVAAGPVDGAISGARVRGPAAGATRAARTTGARGAAGAGRAAGAAEPPRPPEPPAPAEPPVPPVPPPGVFSSPQALRRRPQASIE